MMYKHYLRELLGLAFIISVVLGSLSLLLDLLAVFAYWSHEELIANLFLHESLYYIVFIIPPYFIAKFINQSELTKASGDYLKMKRVAENS